MKTLENLDLLTNYLIKNDSEWLVNIDDDDLIINYKFEKFLNYLTLINEEVKAIIAPRLILNTPIYYFRFHYKKKLFLKYNNQKMSYFEFKEKFGDFDTTIFVKKIIITQYIIK